MRIDMTIQGGIDEIGYLLHKNPNKANHEFSVPYGKMYLYFPPVEPEITQMSLHLAIEPELSVLPQAQHPLAAYVAPLPYESGVLMASGISHVFHSLLKGECKAKPELVDHAYGIQMIVSGMRCKEHLQARLMQILPELGWQGSLLEKTAHHVELQFQTKESLVQCVRKLVVLLRAFDGSQPYKLQDQDVEKLLKWSEGWLNQVTYGPWLRGRILRDPKLIERFDEQMYEQAPEIPVVEKSISTEVLEDAEPTAYEQRVTWVFQELKSLQEQKGQPLKIVDIGGAGGKFILRLLECFKAEGLALPVCVLVEPDTTERGYAQRRLGSYVRSKQVEIVYGALGYALPQQASGADVYLLIEMIEHLPVEDVGGMLNTFLSIQPPVVLLTTPNHTYNTTWGWEPGRKRHWDHKQEWSYEGFRSFLTERVPETCMQTGYIGMVLPQVGGMTTWAKLQNPTLLQSVEEVPTLPTKTAMQAVLRCGRSLQALPWLPSTIAPVSGSLMESLRHQIPPTSWDGRDRWAKERCNVHHLLEHPEAAFAYYRAREVQQVLVETKHMGSRMIASPVTQSLYSRNGRELLYRKEEQETRKEILKEVQAFLQYLYAIRYLPSETAITDGELLPWASKAGNLLTEVYGPLAEVRKTHRHTKELLTTIQQFRSLQAYEAELGIYGASGPIQYAIWTVLPASPNKMADPVFHELLAEYITNVKPVYLKGTPYQVVDLADPASCQDAITAWWEAHATEGIVVKPIHSVVQTMAPMIKVRNPEYLRLIYGPEYPTYLKQLKGRSTGKKMKHSMDQATWGRVALTSFLEGNTAAHARAMLALFGAEEGDDPRL